MPYKGKVRKSALGGKYCGVNEKYRLVGVQNRVQTIPAANFWQGFEISMLGVAPENQIACA
jgi:hypothetical protein